MTIAIDDWSARQGGEDAGEVLEHEGTLESDVHGGAVDEVAGAGAGDAAPQDDALAAKKAKDMKIMKFAGGVLLVMGLGVGGLMAVGGQRGNTQAQQQSAPEQGQVLAQAPAPVLQVAQPVELSTPPAVVAQQLAPVAPVAPAALELSPAPVAVAQASVGVAPAQSALPLAAVTPAALLVQPVQAAAAAVVAESESKAAAAMRTDIEALRAEVQAVRSESAGKDKLIADLRKQVAPARNVQHVAVAVVKKVPAEVIITEPRASREATLVAAKASVSKVIADQKSVVIVDPQVVAETRQTMVSPPASAKGGKVRSEFTVYAVSNGRAWLTWGKDGMNYTVGVNSELPDYSKVTSIDDVRGIVFTSAGEVHPKPATK